MPVRMTSIALRGFKTIREMDFAPRPLNVLIGANGAGKSNFVSFFRLLNSIASEDLQSHVALAGGAHAILHKGPSRTKEMTAEIAFEESDRKHGYAFRLAYAAADALAFAEESYRFYGLGLNEPPRSIVVGSGNPESRLADQSARDQTARRLLRALRDSAVHQFHNTSPESRIRGKWAVQDNHSLKEDGANLAPFLMRLQEQEPLCYRRIVNTLRTVLPFFSDFEFMAAHGSVILQWREKGSDIVFDASQASDGMLRAMSLVALLGQPEQDLPAVLVLDEPELGLHPFAIEIVAGMIRSTSKHAQIFVATQSAPFVDEFEPEDVVVVDREGSESRFHRLDGESLQDWLEEYTLGELWKKNVVGGRPTR